MIKDKLIIVKGEAKKDDYKGKGYIIDGKEVFTLEQIRQLHAYLKLHLNDSMIKNGVISDLQALLSTYNMGKSPVVVEYEGERACAILHFGETWRVNINDQMLTELDGLLGADKVELDYSTDKS